MSTGMAPASTGGAPASTGSAPASTGGGSTGVASSSAAAFMGWGDGWRDRMAGGDQKELARLQRFQSPEDVYKSFRSMETKQSSGELRSTLPKDAPPEQVALWRAENGIPAKFEDYKINMPEGRTAPKEDDAFLNTFRKSAHAANYTQAQMDAAVGSFYAEVDRQESTVSEAHKRAEMATEDELRKEWGQDYRTNKAMAEALLARAPAGFRDRFMNGYLEDHTPIKASAESWKWLVQMEREINPFSTVVPAGEANVATAQARLAELKKLMANDKSEYWKGPKADALQAEYRALSAGVEKVKAKQAA